MPKFLLLGVVFVAVVAIAATDAKTVAFAGDRVGLWKINLDDGSAKQVAHMHDGDTNPRLMVGGAFDPTSKRVLVGEFTGSQRLLGVSPEDGSIVEMEGTTGSNQHDSVVTASGRVLVAQGSLVVEYDTSVSPMKEVMVVGGGSNSDGVGTDAQLDGNPGMCLDNSDGESVFYVEGGASTFLRKISPDGKVTVLIIPGGSVGDEGAGTSVNFQGATSCVTSANGETLFVRTTYQIYAVDMTSDPPISRILAGNDGSDVEPVDGVGTDASLYSPSFYWGGSTGIALSRDESTIFFPHNCATSQSDNGGSVIRKLDIGTQTVSRFSGDYIAAGCLDTSSDPIPTGGDADSAVYGGYLGMYGGFHTYTEICGKFFPITTTSFDLSAEELAACDDIEGGDLPGTVVITGKGIPLTEDANVGDAQIGEDGELSVAEGATVTATSIVVSGNGSVFCNGGDLEASSLTLNDASFFRVLIAKTNNGKGVINGNAKLAGFVVVIVDGAYDWAEGASNVILTFLTKEGSFKGVQTYTQAPEFGRRLLQAASAEVDCTDTECTATSSSGGDDDDDNVGLLAAVIVLAVIIVIGVFAAVVVVAKNTSDKNVSKMSAAAAPYGYSSSSSSFGESSTSSYY